MSWVIGFDEVGMGCLAGPVVAAAFAYPLDDCWLKLRAPCRVRDSKTLSEDQRLEAADWLRSTTALWSVCEASVEEIDTINILRAAQTAMARCFEELREKIAVLAGGRTPPTALLVDGNKIPEAFRLPRPWTASCIVKGDNKSFPIAAASILAKVHRDGLMTELAQTHPHYGWESNAGYGTPQHRLAIGQHGPTPLHRRSFAWGVESPLQGRDNDASRAGSLG